MTWCTPWVGINKGGHFYMIIGGAIRVDFFIREIRGDGVEAIGN